MTLSAGAAAYLASHAIEPDVAELLGWREDRGSLVIPCSNGEGDPTDRRRSLDGGPKVIGERGATLGVTSWWPGRPLRDSRWVLATEGEVDAAAAVSALLAAEGTDEAESAADYLDGLAIASVPGTGFPVKRLVEAMRAAGAQRVAVCFDADESGRRASERAIEALRDAGIDAYPVLLPDDQDLADVLAAEEPEMRAHRLATLLHESADAQGEAAEPPATTVEPPGTRDLLDSIEAFMRRYVVMSDDAAAVLALFVLHSHAFEAAHATPYVVVLSPERRAGKTLLLEVVELLVARAWRVSSTSEAAMFRKIAADRPTLLLDEIDTIFTSNTERAEGLRAILNAGNRPGSAVARCVGKGSEQTVAEFEVFCPKLLAGIDTGRLPDTIRDRAIELRMARKTDAERVEGFRHRQAAPIAGRLGDQAAAWARQHVEALCDAEPETPAALNDRAADAWEPLLAIADLAGGDWPGRARRAAVSLAGSDGTDEQAHGSRILGVLRDEVLAGAATVSTEMLLGRLNADDELPYGAWRDGRGIDARSVARLLRPYGLVSRSVRLPDGTTPKGYRRDQTAEDAFARYLPAQPRSAADPPHVPPHATHPPQETPLHKRDVADVADVALLTGREGEDDVAGSGATGEPLAPPEQEAFFARHAGQDDLDDLAPEQPLPDVAADALPAESCRCDRPTPGRDEDGDPRCVACGHLAEPT